MAAVLSGTCLQFQAGAETLDSIAEYGNAATANATSGAGIARGFTNPAADEYTVTAGGTDFWSGTDHGSFIYDADGTRAAGENFSAVVRSVAVAGDPAEALAGEWGRTGPMVRKNPTAANSANVAHIRKSGSGNGHTVLQWRPADGQGTTRNAFGDGNYGYHGNVAENSANGSVRNTPIWLAIHRLDGTYYTSWAPDAGGSPGTWSDTRIFPATPDLAGEVYVGLAHQSHNINPVINTATFDNFSVGEFDLDLAAFPLIANCDISFTGLTPALSAFGSELNLGPAEDVAWEVTYVEDGLVEVPGKLSADIFLAGNAGNIDAFNTLVAGDPAGSTQIETIRWASNNYTETNAGGVNLFAEAVPGSFGGGQDNYAVNLTGEIHIPSDVSRDSVEEILFHDGVDDFCYLEIDGVVLINDNSWSNLAGDGNNGGAQAIFDCSDAKFDDGEWVTFRMGTWEGGGGDDALLVWDALDRGTGIDDVTGGTDAAGGTYLGTGLGAGNQISFAHDAGRSDEIPSANFRTFVPATGSVIDGFGQPTDEALDDLTPATVALEVRINGELCETVSVIPFIDYADFTDHDTLEIRIQDVGTGGTADFDDATTMLAIDGNTVTPASVNKVDQTTTIIYDFPSAPSPYTIHSLVVTGNKTAGTGGAPLEMSSSARSFPINEELRAGLPAPPNSTVGWDVMEFDVIAALGVGLGGGELGFVDAQTVIRDGAILAQANQPYINHADPDSNATSGDWNPDLPILSDDAGVGDDQFVTYARTIVTIAEGDQGPYTFRIRGDDGYGLRVDGGEFTSIAGSGVNMLDPRDPTVAFFPNFTGDSNAFAVCNFPAAGDYLVEFFGFEGGGGAYQEIAWAPGTFTAFNQTIGWQLLGDTSGFISESQWGPIAESVLPPDPSGEDCGWSTYIWYDATVGNLANTLNFINGADPAGATATILPQLNHSDDAGAAGGPFGGNEAFPGDPNGGDTNNIAMLARAYIVAPADGDYTIQVRSDDGFLLRFVDPSNQFSSVSGGGTLHPTALNEVYFPNGTGDTNTRASINLAAGTYEVLFVWWEGGGGSHFEVSASPGVVPDHGPTYELLSDVASATNLYLGKPTEPEFRITAFVHDTVNNQFTLTWDSVEGASYTVKFDTDLSDFEADITDDVQADPGDSTTFGPFNNPDPGATRLQFRIERN